MKVIINVSTLYNGQAKINDIDIYLKKVLEAAGEAKDVVLCGPGPIWLYLMISHALHGKVRSLSYSSPVTGEIVIYNHNPY